MPEKLSFEDMEREDQDLAITVLTCEGDICDPAFPHQLDKLLCKLQKLISADDQPFLVTKVEPWNSVRVTFNIPREAAQRLRQLAERGDRELRELGILSVQIEGDQVITLTLAGQYGEPQEIILGKSSDSHTADSHGNLSGSEGSPGPSNVEATRKNIAQYLSQQGGLLAANSSSPSGSGLATTSSSAVDVLLRNQVPPTLSSQEVGFRSPNVVAPASSGPIPFLSTSSPSRTSQGAPIRVTSNYGPFPFASMTHAMYTKNSSTAVSAAASPSSSSSHSHPSPVHAGSTSRFPFAHQLSVSTTNVATNTTTASTSNTAVAATISYLRKTPPIASPSPPPQQQQSSPSSPRLSLHNSVSVSNPVFNNIMSRVATASSSAAAGRANVASSSPLLVNLLQSDMSAQQQNKLMPPPTPDSTQMSKRSRTRKPRRPKGKPEAPPSSSPLPVSNPPGPIGQPVVSVSALSASNQQPSSSITATKPVSSSSSSFDPLGVLSGQTFTVSLPNIPTIPLSPPPPSSPSSSSSFTPAVLPHTEQRAPKVVHSANSGSPSQATSSSSPPSSTLHSVVISTATVSLIRAPISATTVMPTTLQQQQPCLSSLKQHELEKRVESNPFPSPPCSADSNKTKHLINPFTGHLEPMPSEDEEEESTGSLPPFPEFEVETSENGQSERNLLDVGKENNQSSDTDSGISKSHTDVSQSSVDFGLDSMQEGDNKPVESAIISKANKEETPTAAVSSVTGEKITLRLKLGKEAEAKEKRNKLDNTLVSQSSYRVDVSFVNIPPPMKRNIVTTSSSSHPMSSEPRVPPLHISLRGPNAAVVVSPRKEEGRSRSHSGNSNVAREPTDLQSPQDTSRIDPNSPPKKVKSPRSLRILSGLPGEASLLGKTTEGAANKKCGKLDMMRESKKGKDKNGVSDKGREQKLLTGGCMLQSAGEAALKSENIEVNSVREGAESSVTSMASIVTASRGTACFASHPPASNKVMVTEISDVPLSDPSYSESRIWKQMISPQEMPQTADSFPKQFSPKSTNASMTPPVLPRHIVTPTHTTQSHFPSKDDHDISMSTGSLDQQRTSFKVAEICPTVPCPREAIIVEPQQHDSASSGVVAALDTNPGVTSSSMHKETSSCTFQEAHKLSPSPGLVTANTTASSIDAVKTTCSVTTLSTASPSSVPMPVFTLQPRTTEFTAKEAKDHERTPRICLSQISVERSEVSSDHVSRRAPPSSVITVPAEDKPAVVMVTPSKQVVLQKQLESECLEHVVNTSVEQQPVQSGLEKTDVVYKQEVSDSVASVILKHATIDPEHAVDADLQNADAVMVSCDKHIAIPENTLVNSNVLELTNSCSNHNSSLSASMESPTDDGAKASNTTAENNGDVSENHTDETLPMSNSLSEVRHSNTSASTKLEALVDDFAVEDRWKKLSSPLARVISLDALPSKPLANVVQVPSVTAETVPRIHSTNKVAKLSMNCSMSAIPSLIPSQGNVFTSGCVSSIHTLEEPFGEDTQERVPSAVVLSTVSSETTGPRCFGVQGGSMYSHVSTSSSLNLNHLYVELLGRKAIGTKDKVEDSAAEGYKPSPDAENDSTVPSEESSLDSVDEISEPSSVTNASPPLGKKQMDSAFPETDSKVTHAASLGQNTDQQVAGAGVPEPVPKLTGPTEEGAPKANENRNASSTNQSDNHSTPVQAEKDAKESQQREPDEDDSDESKKKPPPLSPCLPAPIISEDSDISTDKEQPLLELCDSPKVSLHPHIPQLANIVTKDTKIPATESSTSVQGCIVSHTTTTPDNPNSTTVDTSSSDSPSSSKLRMQVSDNKPQDNIQSASSCPFPCSKFSLSETVVPSRASTLLSATENPKLEGVSLSSTATLDDTSSRLTSTVTTVLSTLRNSSSLDASSGRLTLIFKGNLNNASPERSVLSTAASTCSATTPPKTVPIKLVTLPSGAASLAVRSANQRVVEILSSAASASQPSPMTTSSSSPVRLVVSKVAPMSTALPVMGQPVNSLMNVAAVVVKSVVVTSTSPSIKIVPAKCSTSSGTSTVSACAGPTCVTRPTAHTAVLPEVPLVMPEVFTAPSLVCVSADPNIATTSGTADRTSSSIGSSVTNTKTSCKASEQTGTATTTTHILGVAHTEPPGQVHPNKGPMWLDSLPSSPDTMCLQKSFVISTAALSVSPKAIQISSVDSSIVANFTADGMPRAGELEGSKDGERTPPLSGSSRNSPLKCSSDSSLQCEPLMRTATEDLERHLSSSVPILQNQCIFPQTAEHCSSPVTQEDQIKSDANSLEMTHLNSASVTNTLRPVSSSSTEVETTSNSSSTITTSKSTSALAVESPDSMALVRTSSPVMEQAKDAGLDATTLDVPTVVSSGVNLVVLKPLKRKSSENAAELIKACMGVEDSPRRMVSGRQQRSSSVDEKGHCDSEKEDTDEKVPDADIGKLRNLRLKRDEACKKVAASLQNNVSECSSEDELSLSELANKSRAKTRSAGGDSVISSRGCKVSRQCAKENEGEEHNNNRVASERRSTSSESWKSDESKSRGSSRENRKDTSKKAPEEEKMTRRVERVRRPPNKGREQQRTTNQTGRIGRRREQDNRSPSVQPLNKEESEPSGKRKTRASGSADKEHQEIPVAAKRRRTAKDTPR